jgi:acyl-CoA reductase-like NAD-dependent aldehyde dehydrogenase
MSTATSDWESHLPFGGRSGKSSGVGRVGGCEAMETFTEPMKVVVTR